MRKTHGSRLLPDRPLTGTEAGLILGVVALVVFCCLGAMVLGLFADPAPVPVYTPVPVPSTSQP